MDIIQNNNLRFKSLNHPIKPFSMKVGKDVIKFNELNYSEKPKLETLIDIFKFFTNNFAHQSSCPGWEKCRFGTNTFDKEVFIIPSKNWYQKRRKSTQKP